MSMIMIMMMIMIIYIYIYIYILWPPSREQQARGPASGG